MRKLFHSGFLDASGVSRAYRVHLSDRESEIPLWMSLSQYLIDTCSCRIWVSTSPHTDDATRKPSIVPRTEDNPSILERGCASRIFMRIGGIDASTFRRAEKEGAIYLCRDHFSSTEKRYPMYGIIIGLFWLYPTSICEESSNIFLIGSKNISEELLNIWSTVSLFRDSLTIKWCDTIQNIFRSLCFIGSTGFDTLEELSGSIVLTGAKCWENVDTFYTVCLIFLDEGESFPERCTIFSSYFFDTDIHRKYKFKTEYKSMIGWMWEMLLALHDPSDISGDGMLQWWFLDQRDRFSRVVDYSEQKDW